LGLQRNFGLITLLDEKMEYQDLFGKSFSIVSKIAYAIWFHFVENFFTTHINPQKFIEKSKNLELNPSKF
jgi:hypothetical protein